MDVAIINDDVPIVIDDLDLAIIQGLQLVLLIIMIKRNMLKGILNIYNTSGVLEGCP
jgi:hypothetical protein